MTNQCTAQLLADLAVTRSLSRPQVSDDNPFSEAQFKTLKYHPSLPGRFGDQDWVKSFWRSFFPWYNTKHRHVGELHPSGEPESVVTAPSNGGRPAPAHHSPVPRKWVCRHRKGDPRPRNSCTVSGCGVRSK